MSGVGKLNQEVTLDDYSPEETETEDDTVAEALKRAEKAMECWGDLYEKAREDLLFLSDEPGAQWNSSDYQARVANRVPVITIDQLMQFVNQVANNIRMNTPSINIIPGDQEADEETAEIFKGRIKDIEHTSRADLAYDCAVLSAIKCGFGYIRVDHDWRNDAGFEQDILIKRVINPFSIIIDPQSTEPDGSDMRYAFVIEEITKDDFYKRYPDKECKSFDISGYKPAGESKEEMVCVAEYFEVEEEEERIGLLEDGTSEAYQNGRKYLRTRANRKRTIKRYMLSGAEVLEETTFPGRFIPIVPVYGEESWIAGKRQINSLIRRSKDAQRMYNFWKTMEAELLMRAPKSVAIAPTGTTENYEEDWLSPNKPAVLRYDPVTLPNGQVAPPPTLTPPPPIPAGIVNASISAQNDIRATLGLYGAYLGEKSNEQSGLAINARKVQGETVTYHFGDNLVISIEQVGRILVGMIPEIDVGPRIVRVIGAEDDTNLVGVNGALVEGQERTYDLERGQYTVRVTTGASTATMRQEAALLFQEMLAKNPALLNVFGDLMFKYQDFPGSQAAADRAKAILLPEVRATIEGERPPEVVALENQLQQMQQAMAAMQQELQSSQNDTQIKMIEASTKAQSEQAKALISADELALKEREMEANIAARMKELALKEREIALKERELGIRVAEDSLAALTEEAGVVASPMAGQ